MLLLQRRLCKHLNFAQDIQVHRKLFVTSIATQLSVLMLIKWCLIDLLIIAQRTFLNLRFFAFVLLKEKHNEPHFDIMTVLSHQLMCWGLRSQEYFPHGRKPVKINFLTSCSYKKCCLWLHSNQSRTLWIFLRLFLCLKISTEETNEEGCSSNRFFLKDKSLDWEFSQDPLPVLLETFYCSFGHR